MLNDFDHAYDRMSVHLDWFINRWGLFVFLLVASAIGVIGL